MNNHCSNMMVVMNNMGLMVVAGMSMMVFASHIVVAMMMVSIMLGSMSCGSAVCASHAGCGVCEKGNKTAKSCHFVLGQQLFIAMGFILGLFLG